LQAPPPLPPLPPPPRASKTTHKRQRLSLTYIPHNMASSAAVLAACAGSGPACDPQESASLKVLEAVGQLAQGWARPDSRTVHDKLAGNWRLVWTSSDGLRQMSAIPGGPVEELHESIGEDTVHIAALHSMPMVGLLSLAMLVVNLAVAVALPTGFMGGVVLALLSSWFVRAVATPGLFASRRREFKVDSDLICTSRLERDVIVLSASSAKFVAGVPEGSPMPEFCAKFDASHATKDPLSHGLMFGWRIAMQPLALHVLSDKKLRRERVVYVDEGLRVMQGGDVLKDGSTSESISIFVRE
jgi:hypothetical protein